MRDMVLKSYDAEASLITSARALNTKKAAAVKTEADLDAKIEVRRYFYRVRAILLFTFGGFCLYMEYRA